MTDLVQQRAKEMLLLALNDDELSIEDATKFLSTLGEQTDVKVRNAIHAVVHFLTDQDIRHVDLDYDRLQRQSLAVMLEVLQQSSSGGSE